MVGFEVLESRICVSEAKNGVSWSQTDIDGMQQLLDPLRATPALRVSSSKFLSCGLVLGHLQPLCVERCSDRYFAQFHTFLKFETTMYRLQANMNCFITS